MTTIPRKLFWVIGLVAGVASVLGYFIAPDRFFHAYLVGYLLWLGITLGAVPIVMLHNLTGGRWHTPIHHIVRAQLRNLPMLVVLFLPIVFGMAKIYPWAHADAAHNHHMETKLWYLNTNFFLARAALYFIVWLGIAFILQRASKGKSAVDLPDHQRRPLQRFSAFGLLIFGFTVTFAAIDWVMSLEPRYFSTIFGLILLVGQWLAALAFATLVVILAPPGKRGDEIPPERLNDLGNMLLMSVMLWTYVNFSQFLITWSGQLPEELLYYNHRFHGGWQYVGMVMLGLAFIMPFFLLLFRRVKRSLTVLAGVAAVIMFTRWLDMIWLVEPNLHPMAFTIHWLDFTMPMGIGGLWMGMFFWHLERRTA